MDKTKNNKKLKRSSSDVEDNNQSTDSKNANAAIITNDDFLSTQSSFLSSLTTSERDHFFSSHHVTTSRRAVIWEQQADTGEALINRFSWATPDDRALKILKHFGPIVEIGCGANAYWARRMAANGIDVVAFDSCLEDGGRIVDGDGGVGVGDSVTKIVADGFVVRRGGPDILSSDEWCKDKNNQSRALFLCYPDEGLPTAETEDEDDQPRSMANECLKHYGGNTVIHVGELFGDTLAMDRAPWGRTSAPEFQEQLAQDYHCLLRAKIPNWLHTRDTISVWRRTERCSILYQGDGDGESDCEDGYRYIAPDEVLPSDVAAPCVKHLLS